MKNTNFSNNKQKENKESETTNVFKYSNESAFNYYLFYDQRLFLEFYRRCDSR